MARSAPPRGAGTASRPTMAVRTALALATALALDARWSKLPGGPSARSGACASAGGGAVHVFGGYLEAADGSRSVSNDLWRFADGTWTEVAAASPGAPRPRLCSTLCETKGSLLVLGGWDPGAKGDGGDILDDVWLYEKGAWTELDARLPGPRSRHAACSLDDGRVVAVTHREASASAVIFLYRRLSRADASVSKLRRRRGVHNDDARAPSRRPS